MNTKILEALAKLDPQNDNHWTASGEPRIDTVKMLAGDQSITRDTITIAAPLFNRDSALAGNVPSSGEGVTQETAPAQANAAQEPVVQQPPVAPPVTQEPPVVTQQAPAVVPPVVAPPVVQDATENKSELSLAVDVAKNQLENEQAKLSKAQAAYDKAQKVLDDAINALHASGEGETSAQAISGYLQSQRKILASKAARVDELREMGLSPKALQAVFTAKAPIDQARAKR